MSTGGTLHAPARDGAVVAAPPLRETGRLLAFNRERLDAWQRPLLGRPWQDVRRQARRDVVTAACIYLARRGENVSRADPDSLLVAGHQPELFHPGVWVKNFALNGLARAHDCTPLNLIVDNDTVKSVALRMPSRASVAAARPHAVTVPFDRWSGEVPYEERTIADRDFFAGFARRAMDVLGGWGYMPLLPAFWDEVLRQAKEGALLGECFAAARRTFERAWGCWNLEVPLSAVCRTESFAWFACDLLADLPRFHAAYNDCVRAYRVAHGIRSRNHPVPDLAAEGTWLEAPFWGWRRGRPRRERMFARTTAGRIELRAGDDPWPALPAATAVAAWQALEAEGFKVRSRALTTTLYARLLLADLFIHGIGGGKYDELTDDIIRRHYGNEPPAFLVLSATLWLPLPSEPGDAEDCRRLAHAVRDVHYNPQRHLDDAADLRELVEQKQAWIRRQPADAVGRRQRFGALRALTARLREPLAGRERQLREQLVRCERERAANAIMRRRDYSFCLHPEATLRPFCTQFFDDTVIPARSATSPER